MPCEPLGVGEDRVDVLHERVGRQTAVGLAEVHRAARGDDAHPELLCRSDLGLDETDDPAREDVVMVEDGGAARSGELGEAAPRRRVLHLVVDPCPDRVQRLQPREEVGLLRARACEGLVQVVVGVHEAGGDDCAAEILCAGRRFTAVHLRDQAVLDPQPAALVLGSAVVHRDDPRVAVGGHEAASGTSSNRSTSTSPWSVSFSDGITESARNERCWNGASSVQPS